MSRENQLQLIEEERRAAEASIAIEIAAAEPLTTPPYIVLSEDENLIRFPMGLSGSLTRLVDGTSYLIAGNSVEITSASNGPITISVPVINVSLQGTDGEVQFNDGETNIGGDQTFKFDKTTKTLTTSYLSSSLTRLSDGSPYLRVSGLVSTTTGSSITISRSLSDDISTETWKSFTPSITATGISPTLPSDIISIGKYVYSSGIMKMIFKLSSRLTAGAQSGTGTYLINMPDGYEVDIDLIPKATVEAPLGGMSIGIAGITLDVVGGGGAWSIVPISTSQLILVGKAPADTTINTWGSNKFPFGAGNDYQVSFTVTIPAQIAETYNWQGPGIQLAGGTFTVTGPQYANWTGPDIQLANGTWPAPTLSQYMTLGTIFVEGALTLNVGSVIELYGSTFYHPGIYVLFDYSAPGASFTGNQASLNSNVTLVCVDLPSTISTISTAPFLTNDVTNKRILLTVPSNPTNGKIFVEGNLTIQAGVTQMFLDKKLYATPGTYELFEFTGDCNGVEYLTCTSAAGFTCGAPYKEGNLVKVTLST